MKFYKLSLFVGLLVAVCLPAFGQTEMQVNVPFNFVAAGKSLPAGHYKLALQGFNAAWSISNNDTGALMLANVKDSTRNEHQLSLVFRHAGGAYSLVEIWDHHSGWGVPQLKAKQTLVSKDDSKGSEYIEIGAE